MKILHCAADPGCLSLIPSGIPDSTTKKRSEKMCLLSYPFFEGLNFPKLNTPIFKFFKLNRYGIGKDSSQLTKNLNIKPKILLLSYGLDPGTVMGKKKTYP
jgi:hypothetical protein